MSSVPLRGTWPPDWWIYFQQAAVKAWCWYRGIVVVPVVVQPTRADLRRTRRLRFFASLGLLAAFVCMLPARVVAAPDQNAGNEHAVVTEKKVTGEVSVIRPHYISVVSERDPETRIDTEMVFPINEDVEFVYTKGLDELHVGDTVRVTYEERTWTQEDEEFERTARHATAT